MHKRAAGTPASSHGPTDRGKQGTSNAKRAHSLARLNGRILKAFSQRTTQALRKALPLRLALPHLEPVLALNLDKEVAKDRLVILRAEERRLTANASHWHHVLPQLLQATKEIDQAFLASVGRFPIKIVIRYEEVVPIRTRRIKLLHDTAQELLAAGADQLHWRGAMQKAFSEQEFQQRLDQLLRLYAEETRSLSRSVRLPLLLVPMREFIAQELLKVMLGVVQPLTLEIAASAFRPPPPKKPKK